MPSGAWAPGEGCPELAEAPHALPAEFRAAYLDARRHSATGGRAAAFVERLARLPMVADRDVATIALAARTMTSLRCQGAETVASRVPVAEGDTLPSLGRLLMAAGIFDLALWKETDAVAFPLERVAESSDVLIGPRTGSHNDLSAQSQTRAVVSTLNDISDSAAPVPGILNVVVDASFTSADIDACAAVTHALSTLTPPGKDFPDVERTLVDSIGWVARQALRYPRSEKPGTGR